LNPISDTPRFEAAAAGQRSKSDLAVRGWRFSYNAAPSSSSESPGGPAAAIIVVHPGA